MTQRLRILAAGPDWRVSDVICSAGPHDRRFEEQHPGVCIAVVTRGTFHYRTTQGAATLLPGAILLGNTGACFECGHDHSTGDRCLSFHYEAALFEDLAKPGGFRQARLPPLPALAPVVAAAALAQETDDPSALEDMAFDLATHVVALLRGQDTADTVPSSRDERRIAAAIHRIEREFHVPLSLDDLASDVAMSRFHFLRTFRRLTGVTPHQFILRTRLHYAALDLARTNHAVLDVALEAGFADLSSFNRRFRETMGLTPTAYRRQAGVHGRRRLA